MTQEVLKLAREAGGYDSPQYPNNLVMDFHDLERFTALVREDAQRKPLSDEDIDAIWDATITPSNHIREFVRAIEAAHGIKE